MRKNSNKIIKNCNGEMETTRKLILLCKLEDIKLLAWNSHIFKTRGLEYFKQTKSEFKLQYLSRKQFMHFQIKQLSPH